MVTKIIADVLRNDTVGTTASAVAAAYPSIFVNGPSSVPAYLYQPLSTLWGPSGNIPLYQQRIVTDLGTGATNSGGSIVVTVRRLLEQVVDPSSFLSDTPGAEIAYVGVILYKPQQLSTDTILNAALRVRYLIDTTIRAKRSLGQLPNSSVFMDTSIDWRYPVMCFFQEHDTEQIASQCEILFKVDYVRLFI